MIINHVIFINYVSSKYQANLLHAVAKHATQSLVSSEVGNTIYVTHGCRGHEAETYCLGHLRGNVEINHIGAGVLWECFLYL